jgi:hypothetical protein
MTAVHVVTLLEEMPVQETVDAIGELGTLGIPVGRVIVNGARPPLLARGRVTKQELRRGLAAAGLPTDPAVVSALQAEAQDHLTRRALEESLRAELAELGRPVVELPLLERGVDRAGLTELAGLLGGRA